MTTELKTTVLSDVKTKLKSIEYSYLIDKYFTNQNLVIMASIIVFFLLLVTTIVVIRTTSNDSVEIKTSDFKLLEENMKELNRKQESIQISLKELIDSMQLLSEQSGLSTKLVKANMSSNDLPDISLDEFVASDMEQNIPVNDSKEIGEISNKNDKLNKTDSKKQNKFSIEHEFNIEDVSKRWKNKTELNIITLLEQKDYEDVWFDKLECKSKTCKLEINHISKTRSDSFKTKFPLALDGLDVVLSIEDQVNGKYLLKLFLRDKISEESNEDNQEIPGLKTKNISTARIKSINKNIKIEDKFKQEDIDNRWRKLIEFKIMTVLNNNKFRKTWFDSLLCKTSVCKLVITHNKKRVSNAFIEEFPLTLDEFEKKKAKVKKNKNGNYKTTMYLQQHY